MVYDIAWPCRKGLRRAACQALFENGAGSHRTMLLATASYATFMERALREGLALVLTGGRDNPALVDETILNGLARYKATFVFAAASTDAFMVSAGTEFVAPFFAIGWRCATILYEANAKSFTGDQSALIFATAIRQTLVVESFRRVLTFNLAGTVGATILFQARIKDLATLFYTHILCPTSIDTLADELVCKSLAAIFA
jgi:hypothetical protein